MRQKEPLRSAIAGKRCATLVTRLRTPPNYSVVIRAPDEQIADVLLSIQKRRRQIIRLSMGEKTKTDLLPGTLDMLVLKILMRGHLHGYAIAQLIQQLSGELLRVEEGSLYPALQRLELNGWIEGETDNPAV